MKRAGGVRTRKVADGESVTQRTSYYVYLLLCDDGSYYTGYTNNVASRLERHKKGHGARYTRMRKPRKVVYVEKFSTRVAAIRRERRIKALSHEEKHYLASTCSVRVPH
jgi:putative endonuclease